MVISGQSIILNEVSSKHNFYDAQLSRNVLQLVNYCMEEQQGHGYRCHPQLEVAFLSFFLIFRRTFVNDQKSFAIIREYEDCKNGPIPQRAEVASIFGVVTIGVSEFHHTSGVWGHIASDVLYLGEGMSEPAKLDR